MAIGCFVSSGRSLDAAVKRVRVAEELGYEACYVSHIAGRESLTLVTIYASASERIRIGTGVVPIYTRTPATMAQTAATINEFSHGRLTLGLGVSHQAVVEGWHGQSIESPAKEMREYVQIVRAILRGEDPPAGAKWATGFRLAGVDLAPDLPIYVAALSPTMLRLAGEIADGVLLWLCIPDYIHTVVVPEVAKGRDKVGKRLDGFDIVPAVPTAATDDVAAAHDVLRGDLIPYFALPFYRSMLERSGFATELAEYDGAAGDLDSMKRAISDEFLAELAAVGSPSEVHDGVRRYLDAGATSPCVGPIPRTDFAATLRAAVP